MIVMVEAIFICRRCGEKYSIEEYQRSHFCTKCGTLLKRALEVAPEKRSATDFEGFVREIFPYPDFRPFQLNAIKFAFNIFKNGKIGLLSSPCGTGKSISVLTAFLMAKSVNDSVGRLLTLTRTKNQLEIYCRELKGIKEKRNISLVASIFKSKKEMCPHALENHKLKDIGYRDFLHYCKGLKSGVFGKTCKFYDRVYSAWKPSWLAQNIVAKIKNVGPQLPEEVYNICRDEELCPYEVTKILTRYADIIIGNYNYILVDAIRGSILGRAGIKTEKINCVFDEAHGLPYYAAGLMSDELSTTSVMRAQREIAYFGLEDYGLLEVLRKVMMQLGKRVYRDYGLDVEHVIEREGFINALLKGLDVNANRLLEIISELADAGETVRLKRAEMGRDPVSYTSRCADFLSDFVSVTGSSYVRYVKVESVRNGRKRVRLGVKCLDPALAADVINDLRSAILMSGTLWHMDYYMDVLGLERSRCETLELPSPFPSENRLIIVDRTVTTKFEERNEEQWRRIAAHLTRIIAEADGNIAVYFPSYEVMREILKIAKFDFPVMAEEKRTRILDVLSFLRENSRCAVFGVARGKISEGVDMTMEGRSMLSAVVIVGLPYPKKTELQEALYKYFTEKFGEKAMEYANDIPCLNALAQSAGRLIRSPEDKGVIVIMDGRAAGNFRRKLPRDWREEMKPHASLERIIDEVRSFYETRD
ncbi:MAG: helicase C-terminal domain-containing protein [Candidatus Bathyarchaeia archaeon]